MVTCRACGRDSGPDLRFCPWCGVRVEQRPGVKLDERTAGLLESSTERYSALVRDLDEGRLPPEAFHETALRVGTIVTETGVWLLDAKRGSWWRYDGYSMEPVFGRAAPPTERPPQNGPGRGG